MMNHISDHSSQHNKFRSGLNFVADPKEIPHEPEEPEVPNLPTEPDEPDFGDPITSILGINTNNSKDLNYLTNEDGNEDPGAELDQQFTHRASYTKPN